MKTVFFYLSASLYLMFACAQNATIRGSLVNAYSRNNSGNSIKIYLYNKVFSDSTIMDSSYHFQFKNVPNGLYQLKVNSFIERTGIQNLILMDIPINTDLAIAAIPAVPYSVCEPSIKLMHRTQDKTFYKTGEVLAEGPYKKEHAFFKSKRLISTYYIKNGAWTQYYKTGEIFQKQLFRDGKLISFTEYYPNGKEKLCGEYNSKTNCKTGNWKYYSKEGKLTFIVNFDDISTIKLKYEFYDNYVKHRLEILEY
jgi:hypothetical protein